MRKIGEALGGAVEVGQQVDADLVRKQGVDPRRAGIAVLPAIISLCPETSRLATSSRTSTPASKTRRRRRYVADQRRARASATSAAPTMSSARPARPSAGARIAVRVGEQLRADGAVVEQRRRLERRRVARRQHGQLVVDLLPLFRQQALEQRILDARQVDRVEVALGGVGIDGQRPIAELRRRPARRRRRSAPSPRGVLIGETDSRKSKLRATLSSFLSASSAAGEEGAAAERAEMGRGAGPLLSAMNAQAAWSRASPSATARSCVSCG